MITVNHFIVKTQHGNQFVQEFVRSDTLPHRLEFYFLKLSLNSVYLQFAELFFNSKLLHLNLPTVYIFQTRLIQNVIIIRTGKLL